MSNLNQKRAWVHAKDIVCKQCLMLYTAKLSDYVFANGQLDYVREFIKLSAKQLGCKKQEIGQAIILGESVLYEVGKITYKDDDVLGEDPAYFSPTDAELLKKDWTKFRKELKGNLNMIPNQPFAAMIEKDSNEAKKESLLKKKGFQYIAS